jgi:adenosylcobinamide-GDP ribazoletransferase
MNNSCLFFNPQTYIKLIQTQWFIFNHAIVFFTRLPIQKTFQYQEEYNNKAIRYLPLIGGIVGLWSTIIFVACHFIFSLDISVFFCIIATILLTGAIHEDGFADFCDSLGGITLEKRLEIMKDSHLGAYGMIGLAGILFGKYLLLTHFPESDVPQILISSHVFSRTSILFLILFLPYAGKKESSKSFKLVEAEQKKNVCIGCIITLLFFIYFPLFFILTIPILAITIVFLYYYFKKKIGGYTGDYLGAAQQITEFVYYITILVMRHQA